MSANEIYWQTKNITGIPDGMHTLDCDGCPSGKNCEEEDCTLCMNTKDQFCSKIFDILGELIKENPTVNNIMYKEANNYFEVKDISDQEKTKQFIFISKSSKNCSRLEGRISKILEDSGVDSESFSKELSRQKEDSSDVIEIMLKKNE